MADTSAQQPSSRRSSAASAVSAVAAAMTAALLQDGVAAVASRRTSNASSNLSLGSSGSGSHVGAVAASVASVASQLAAQLAAQYVADGVAAVAAVAASRVSSSAASRRSSVASAASSRARAMVAALTQDAVVRVAKARADQHAAVADAAHAAAEDAVASALSRVSPTASVPPAATSPLESPRQAAPSTAAVSVHAGRKLALGYFMLTATCDGAGSVVTVTAQQVSGARNSTVAVHAADAEALGVTGAPREVCDALIRVVDVGADGQLRVPRPPSPAEVPPPSRGRTPNRRRASTSSRHSLSPVMHRVRRQSVEAVVEPATLLPSARAASRCSSVGSDGGSPLTPSPPTSPQPPSRRSSLVARPSPLRHGSTSAPPSPDAAPQVRRLPDSTASSASDLSVHGDGVVAPKAVQAAAVPAPAPASDPPPAATVAPAAAAAPAANTHWASEEKKCEREEQPMMVSHPDTVVGLSPPEAAVPVPPKPLPTAITGAIAEHTTAAPAPARAYSQADAAAMADAYHSRYGADPDWVRDLPKPGASPTPPVTSPPPKPSPTKSRGSGRSGRSPASNKSRLRKPSGAKASDAAELQHATAPWARPPPPSPKAVEEERTAEAQALVSRLRRDAKRRADKKQENMLRQLDELKVQLDAADVAREQRLAQEALKKEEERQARRAAAARKAEERKARLARIRGPKRGTGPRSRRGGSAGSASGPSASPAGGSSLRAAGASVVDMSVGPTRVPMPELEERKRRIQDIHQPFSGGGKPAASPGMPVLSPEVAQARSPPLVSGRSAASSSAASGQELPTPSGVGGTRVPPTAAAAHDRVSKQREYAAMVRERHAPLTQRSGSGHSSASRRSRRTPDGGGGDRLCVRTSASRGSVGTPRRPSGAWSDSDSDGGHPTDAFYAKVSPEPQRRR